MDWFVLFQIGGLSSGAIRRRFAPDTSDASSILRGIKTAARLLQWKTLRKR
jgi:hypothetical protein